MSSDDLQSGNYFRGDFGTWQEAELARSPTDEQRDRSGLEQHMDLTLKVAKGELAFARDGVGFQHLQLPFALLAVLLRIALQRGGRLSVIDFGGALGNTFFQTRGFLSDLSCLDWAIVELPQVVSMAQKHLSVPGLSFHYSMTQAHESQGCDVVIMSGVAQFLADPQEFADEISDLSIANVVLDRTPVTELDENRICLQTAQTAVGERSWPVRIYSQKRLIGMFSEKYAPLNEFDSYCDPQKTIDDIHVRHKGFHLVRK